MLQSWLNMNIGVQSSAKERYGIRHETSANCGNTNHSMQFRTIEVQRVLNRHAEFNPMQCLGLQPHPTLTVTCTLRNCVVLTRAFITIWSLCTLGIGCWRKSDIVCLWFVTNFRWELACHWLSGWAETGIQILNVFELSWWKSVLTIHFKIREFGGPNIHVTDNAFKTVLEAFWI
jgi:hypothetical protein